MHYTGTIDKSSPTGTAGEKFDSSRDRGQTFDFQIGVGQVIKVIIYKLLQANSFLMLYVSVLPNSQKDLYSCTQCDNVLHFQGWDEGIVGLCKGAKATLILPSEYAYGDAGAGGAIPGKATLNFDVEVVDINDEAKGPPPPPNVFKQIDTDKDGKLSKEEIEGFFKSMGKDVPEGLWENEDRDGSGFIDHSEFSGPKEDHESHEEL